MLPVFVFGEYKWPFRCCIVFNKNFRRFDQILGPYQDKDNFSKCFLLKKDMLKVIFCG